MPQVLVAETVPSAAAREASRRRAARWLLATGTLAVTTLVVLLLVRKGSDSLFHQCYVVAAERMLARERVHVVEENAYAYPPAMALATVPLALLPPLGTTLAWAAINVVATLLVLGAAARWAGFGRAETWTRAQLASVVVGGLLSARFVLAPLEVTQTDMVIAALLVPGLLLWVRGADVAGGLLVGAATAAKCTPLLFAPYFLWRGRPKAAVAVVAAAVALNLLPDLLLPQANGRSYLSDWRESFLSVVVSQAPGTWFSDLIQNQSLAGLVRRYAVFGLPSELPPAGAIGAAASSATQQKAVVYGLAAVLGLLTALAFGRPGRPRGGLSTTARSPESAGGAGQRPLDVPAVAWEIGAVFCLMLLLSPMSSKAHYVTLVVPCLLLARQAVEARQPAAWLAVGLLAMLGPLTNKELLGKTLGDLVLAWGAPTWFVLVLLAAAWWGRRWAAPLAPSTADAPAATRRAAASGPARRAA